MTKTLSQSDVKVLRYALELMQEHAETAEQITAANKALIVLNADAQEAAQGVVSQNQPSSHVEYQKSDNPIHKGDFVTVPRETTEAMLSAGAITDDGTYSDNNVANIYKSMLAAAPRPETIPSLGDKKSFNPLDAGFSLASGFDEEAANPEINSIFTKSQQPESGDARELFDLIANQCPNKDNCFGAHVHSTITAYTARIRAEAVEECAKVVKNKSYVNNPPDHLRFQQLVELEEAIRQLGKRGA